MKIDEINYLEQRKTPAIAILLSFIISGAGQIYNGETGKGIAMIVAYVLLCAMTMFFGITVILLIALWIWGMVDANEKAKKINKALRKKLYQETEAKNLEQTTTISAHEFVEQVEKYLRLYQNSLLTEVEFVNKKNEIIGLLTVKKIREAPEDFLTAVIPLIQKKYLSNDEVLRIKAALL